MQIYQILHQYLIHVIFLYVHLYIKALRVCSRTRPADAFRLLPALASAADDLERTALVQLVTSMRRKFVTWS
eukprot:6201555-Pleurochrysis_carterae.AAC.1